MIGHASAGSSHRLRSQLEEAISQATSQLSRCTDARDLHARVDAQRAMVAPLLMLVPSAGLDSLVRSLISGLHSEWSSSAAACISLDGLLPQATASPPFVQSVGNLALGAPPESLSPRCPVTPSPCHPVAQSPCCPLALSFVLPSRPVTLTLAPPFPSPYPYQVVTSLLDVLPRIEHQMTRNGALTVGLSLAHSDLDALMLAVRTQTVPSSSTLLLSSPNPDLNPDLNPNPSPNPNLNPDSNQVLTQPVPLSSAPSHLMQRLVREPKIRDALVAALARAIAADDTSDQDDANAQHGATAQHGASRSAAAAAAAASSAASTAATAAAAAATATAASKDGAECDTASRANTATALVGSIAEEEACATSIEYRAAIFGDAPSPNH